MKNDYSNERTAELIAICRHRLHDRRCWARDRRLIITIISMLLLIFNRSEISYLKIAVIGILILFISMGAPNQPGGIMIAMVIIFNYMATPELLPIAICCEVLFGAMLNLINVLGNIFVIVCLKDCDSNLRKNKG